VRLSRQRAASSPLDGVELWAFRGCSKTRCMGVYVGAGRAPDPMHVALEPVRQIVVDNSPHAGDVGAARRDVGRDCDAAAAATKHLQSLAPLRLGTTGAQALSRVADVVSVRPRRSDPFLVGASTRTLPHRRPSHRRLSTPSYRRRICACPMAGTLGAANSDGSTRRRHHHRRRRRDRPRALALR